MAVNPQPASLKSGLYSDEVGTFTDITSAFKYLLENHVRYSKTSPPLARDIREGTFVWDKTLSRLYIKSNNVIKYVQFV